jgi:FixJ family two-component response regulator
MELSSTPVYDPSVFVVDDDEQLLDSLVALLEVLGFQVRAFSSAGDFLQFYESEMPGCLVLDIRMPRHNGLAMYEQLLAQGRRLPVIFITAQADVSTAVAAMKSGAIDFLEKPLDRTKLLNSVQHALKLDAQWRRRDGDLESLSRRIDQLSEREKETLRLIRAGESNKSMAAKLFITERAVEMRRSAIMKKLQVRSLAELLDLAITHGILQELRQSSSAPRSIWQETFAP